LQAREFLRIAGEALPDAYKTRLHQDDLVLQTGPYFLLTKTAHRPKLSLESPVDIIRCS